MNVFQFILHLGIINIVFSYVWKWVFVLPSALLFLLIKIDNASYIVKAFGSYLLSSLTAILTLIAIQDNPTILSALLFSFISIFVLYMGYARIEQGTVLCFIIDINLANELFDLLIKRVNKI